MKTPLTIPKREQEQSCPLSFNQKRLWFVHQLEPDRPTYHINRVLRLHGPINIEALWRSFTSILERHEALRTHFVTNKHGVPFQMIQSASKFELPLIDLSASATERSEAKLKSLIKNRAAKPFDLSADLMLRATLFRLDEQVHVLQIIFHHIASDGWSMGVFDQELRHLYEVYLKGRPHTLPKLTTQYADFSEWELKWLTPERTGKLLHYWMENLAGAPPLLKLPTDRPRPPVCSYRGANHSFEISKTFTTVIKRVGRENSSTLFMTLLSAYNALLFRYSHQEDLVIGFPIANRNLRELDNLIGFFANTLALRTDLSGQPSFSELLSRVRAVTIDAYENQNMPFEKLVEELQPKRSLSHSPIFQVMFVLQNAPDSELELPNLRHQPEPNEAEMAQFDLTLSMTETAGGLAGLWHYSSDLFDDTTIKRMSAHFRILLEAMVALPDTPITELPILTNSERDQLLFERNQTQSNYPNTSCIHTLFEEQVEQTPDAIAVIFKDSEISYYELNQLANNLANHLISLGVRSEVNVGICLGRSIEMIVGLLGILKAGGVYIPLDPLNPTERLAFMLEDTQVQILLTERRLEERFSTCSTQNIYLDTFFSGSEDQIELENPDSSTKADQLAYVMYTSGSTGKPKGVSVPHRGVVRLVRNTNYITISRNDIFLQMAPNAFDAATFEIWGALLNGARTVIIDKDTALSPIVFVRKLKEHRVTTLFLTTALFNHMAENNVTAFDSLDTLLFGGERVETKWVNKALGHPKRLLHVYGPTECTTFATWHEVVELTDEESTVPIGRPISNTKAYILDPNQQPVPLGVSGELYLGGDGLAQGYFNRPQLSQEQFIPNPFDSSTEEYLYKTGDAVRYLADGNIEFLGRIDNQVKIRGFRIELGEIEAVINQHPTVKQCAVLAIGEKSDDKALVAYIVSAKSECLTTREWHTFLQQKLPDYMIPFAFERLESMPISLNGKVDRHALPLPTSLSKTSTAEQIPPRTLTEETVARIWVQSLGLPEMLLNGPSQVHVYDNFFDMGGHSLVATQLIHQIRTVLKVEMPVSELFKSPTIADLASYIDDVRQAHSKHQRSELDRSSYVIPFQAGGSKPPFFLVPGGGGGENTLIQYSKLVYLLGQDQPVYGFVSQGIDGKQAPHQSVKTMASDYIKAMRVVQPEGPYILGGECIGGIIAFEMAKQLVDQGQKLGLLVLMDTPLQNALHRLIFKLKRSFIIRRILIRLNNSKSSPKEDRPNYRFSLTSPYVKIIKKYRPTPYPGPVTCLITEGATGNLENRDWKHLVTGERKMFRLPGTHNVYLGQNVEITAEKLRACIRTAQT